MANMDRNLRLKLHVQRNGLPENNVLFNVPLANDPTIANLLELVNEIIPLEDADGEWGLDDYVVEIHDKDSRGQGNAFECLHFQSLAGLLEKDDEVFIRPLLTIDLKKRRLSGRDQILPGGEHIIDGVPFGRPRLRAPRGRPPVAIAPRKRRRLLENQDYSTDYDEDASGELLDDGDYADSGRQLGDAERVQQLLLTRHGEGASRATRQVHFGTRSNSGSDEASDQEYSSVDHADDQDEDEDMAESDAQDLADEAADLRRELAEEEEEEQPRTRSGSRSKIVASDHSKRPSDANAKKFGRSGDGQGVNETTAQSSSTDLALFDKVVAVRAAFNVSHEDAVKLLLKHNKDVSKVWRALERSLRPRQGLAETMVLATQLELPREVQIITSPPRSPTEALGDISRIDDDEQSSTSDDSSEYVSARPSPPHDDALDRTSSSTEASSGESDREQQPKKPTKLQPKQNKTRTSKFSVSLAQKNDASDDRSDTSDSSAEEDSPVTLRTRGRRSHKIISSEENSSNSDASSESSSSSGSDSSSDSSSDSDSDSNSDSGSESESAVQNVVPTVREQRFRDTESNNRSSTVSQQTISQQKALVPPGQGLTRTQRRNQRRRLQLHAKKAALQSSNHPQNVQDISITDADLELKKNALLQSLTAGHERSDEAHEQGTTNVQAADTDSNAWRHKISYRAVECVQEGIELSEPPFPFIQRWDPQQRWDSQPSQRRGKRKLRANSQFYNGGDSHHAKKRRCGQPVDEYWFQEDNTTLLANNDDIELDYDDVTFNPDEDPITNGCTNLTPQDDEQQAEDDLPPLPEDMSSLPVLDAADMKVGMVIAWKQLLCTEATQWQPQLSEYMTASILEIQQGSANLQVQLAWRDRNIDRNLKKYDEETGQRVYGKFEAPDSDEDEDDDAAENEDDGIREMSFSEMVEPRILQQAVEIYEVGHSTELSAGHISSESKLPDPTAPPLQKPGVEVADSQPRPRHEDDDSSGKRDESLDQSGTLDIDQESLIPETLHDKADFPAEHVSITEDRRGEISQLITEGGFRQEVRSSIDRSTFLQFGQGSPSRQLEEEYASSVLLSNQINGSRRSPSSEAPSEYDSKEPMHSHVRLNTQSAETSRIPSPSDPNGPSKQTTNQVNPGVGKSHSGLQTAILQQMRSDSANEADSTRLTTSDGQNSLGRVEYPKLNASQTTQTSDFSGKRQIDPNFITHSDDLGVSFHDDDTGLGDASTDFDQIEHQRPPTQEVYNDGLQTATASEKPSKSTQVDAEPLSRASSVASDRSDSSFPDIKFASSQVVKTKFQELPTIKNEGSISGDGIANDTMPPQSPGLSQHAQISSQPLMDWSPPAAHSIPSTENEKNDSNGDHARPNSVSFQKPISPPALSRPRQTRASSSLQDPSRDKARALPQSTCFGNPLHESFDANFVHGKTKETGFVLPKGSQVVNLVTSSPKPDSSAEPEPEPEFSEMYADDSLDGDYTSNLPKTKKAASTRWAPQAGGRKRQASVPMAEKPEQAVGPGWVGGSQGPSRKPSGRFGGRISSAGGYH